MEKEKNMIMMANLGLQENIQMDKDGMEKEKNIMMNYMMMQIQNLKENI